MICGVCNSEATEVVEMPPSWTLGAVCDVCADVIGSMMMWAGYVDEADFNKLATAATAAFKLLQEAPPAAYASH